MRLYPQDLGGRWHLHFVMRRNSGQAANGALPPTDAPPPRKGIMGRIFAWSSGLSDDQASRALPAANSAMVSTFGVWGLSAMLYLLPIALAKKHVLTPEAAWALAVAIFAAAGSLGLAVGRHVFQSFHKNPLQPGEVAGVLATVSDPLDRAFMELVHDAVRLPGTTQVEEQVRAAIVSLAEALERLPEVHADPVDTSELRQEANAALEQSRLEADPVLAESHSRRARALLQRAQAEESVQSYARRTAGLRAEMLAQTEALRSALRAFDPKSPHTSGLVPLAEAAIALNEQALSLATARAELSGYLAPKQVEPVTENYVRVGG